MNIIIICCMVVMTINVLAITYFVKKGHEKEELYKRALVKMTIMVNDTLVIMRKRTTRNHSRMDRFRKRLEVMQTQLGSLEAEIQDRVVGYQK